MALCIAGCADCSMPPQCPCNIGSDPCPEGRHVADEGLGYNEDPDKIRQSHSFDSHGRHSMFSPGDVELPAQADSLLHGGETIGMLWTRCMLHIVYISMHRETDRGTRKVEPVNLPGVDPVVCQLTSRSRNHSAESIFSDTTWAGVRMRCPL